MKQKTRLVILIILILSFVTISWVVVTKNAAILRFDNSVTNYFDNLRFPTLDDFMLIITKIGNTYESLLIFIIIATILIARKKKTFFYILTIAAALGSILQFGLKYIFERARPIGGLVKETTYSFPSGHATISAIFLISVILLIVPLIKNTFMKWVFGVAATILFALVAASRIFLWVHWPSDVIAGLLLGATCYIIATLIVDFEARA